MTLKCTNRRKQPVRQSLVIFPASLLMNTTLRFVEPQSHHQNKRESDEALLTKNALNYSQVHKASVRAALRQLQVKVRQNAIRGVVRPRDSDLARVMSTEGYVDDFPKQSVPRELLQSSSSKGSMITLGNLRGLVKEELGKGIVWKSRLARIQRGSHCDCGGCQSASTNRLFGIGIYHPQGCAGASRAVLQGSLSVS